MVMRRHAKFGVGELGVGWVKKYFLLGLSVGFCWVGSVGSLKVGLFGVFRGFC